jgi:hypothetical protein
MGSWGTLVHMGMNADFTNSMPMDPPRHGEGDPDAKRRGGGGPVTGTPPPSTSLRLVPLPVPGRI